MSDAAFVHIFGKLSDDIVINEANGIRYGILSVSVAPPLSNKTDVFQIVVWDKEILYHKQQLLKKGKEVTILGELSTIERLTQYYPCNAVIIEVKHRLGVKFPR